jgi:hypothetical protein
MNGRRLADTCRQATRRYVSNGINTSVYRNEVHERAALIDNNHAARILIVAIRISIA